MKHLSLLLLAIILGHNAYSVIRYVTVSGAGSANGSDWSNAYAGNSLQNAITLSGVGDEVWVATGTYYTTAGVNRTVSFNMKNGVAIYGSFLGTETMLSQRVFTTGLSSILSGEIGIVGIADNSYHTIHNTGLNSTAIIDGFVISDANDDRSPTLTNGLGGGIYNDGSGAGNVCSPTIRNCLITNNQAVFGAGIFNSGYLNGTSTPLISHCVIANNLATVGGGGIDNFGLSGNASPTITNCVIYANTATQRAGGMYCWGGGGGNANPTVLNTVFVNNSAVDGGGVVSDRLNSSGGGSSGNSNPNFRNCIFEGNTASGTGPQFFLLGGATFVATYSDINLTGQSAPHVISGLGTGNINVNPLFTNIAIGAGIDGDWFTSDDGLQLQNLSPCIDVGDNAGLPTTDLLFNNRIANVTVDLGVYEFNTIPLAIELTTFFGQNHNNKNHLYWAIMSESSHFPYQIERSIDRITFEKIGTKAVNDSQHYQFIDNFAAFGTNYYRLNQLDIEGNNTYSDIIAIKNVLIEDVILYPNPSKNRVSFLDLPFVEKSIKVVNEMGIIVKMVETRDNYLDITALPSGIYFISIETPTQSIKKQILKE